MEAHLEVCHGISSAAQRGTRYECVHLPIIGDDRKHHEYTPVLDTTQRSWALACAVLERTETMPTDAQDGATPNRQPER